MRSKGWLPLGIVVLGAVASFALATSRPSLETSPAPDRRPLVAVEVVTPAEFQVIVRSQGSVEPRIEIDLAAEASGRVVFVSPSLEAGGFFAADELLIELDSQDARVSIERAQATFERSEIEVRQASVVLDRLRALAKDRIVSAAQREDAEFELELARARRREALAERGDAQRELTLTKIPAPFAGRVRSARIEVGQFVTRGEALARIYAKQSAEVRLPIPDGELAFLDLPLFASSGAVDQSAGPLVSFTALFAGNARRWTGRIVRVEAAINEKSRMIHAVARFDEPPPLTGRPRSAISTPPAVGLFVEAEILGRRFDNVIALPREALRGGTDTVLIVDAQGRVAERSVSVARVDRDEVLIESGLTPGERVCVSPTPPAVGQLVRTVEVPRGADPTVFLAAAGSPS